MVNATNKKDFMVVTDVSCYPCSTLEEAIYQAGCEGSATIFQTAGRLKMSYDYVCDVIVDKEVKKKCWSIQKGGDV